MADLEKQLRASVAAVEKRKATGPRTPEGKAASSKNAITHGLFASRSLLPEESAAELDTFAAGLRSRLAPIGELEELLADRVVSCAWRLSRATRIEGQTFAAEQERSWAGSEEPELNLGKAFIRDANNSGAIEKLARYEAALERSLYRALHELERLRAMRGGVSVAHPAVINVTVAAAREEL